MLLEGETSVGRFAVAAFAKAYDDVAATAAAVVNINNDTLFVELY